MKYKCDTCNDTREITIPKHQVMFMGKVLDIEKREAVCPDCSVATIIGIRGKLSRCNVYSEEPPEYQNVNVTIECVHAIPNSQHLPDDLVIGITNGSVTGYESCYYDEYFKDDVLRNGWRACAGTRGRWDSLEIHADEMKKALTKFQLL